MVSDPETLRRAQELLACLSPGQRERLHAEWGFPLEDPDLVGCGVYSCAWAAYAPDGRDCVVKITDDEQTAAALEKIRRSGDRHDSILVKVYWVGEAQPPCDRHAGVWVAVTEMLEPLSSFAELEPDRQRIMERKDLELARALKRLKIDRRGLELHCGNWGFRDPTEPESLVFFDFSFSDEWLRGRPPLPRLNPPPGWVQDVLAGDKSWDGPPVTPVLERLVGRVPPEWLPARQGDALADELGCGVMGCVLRTRDPGVVLKLSADETEAVFVAWMLALGDDAPSAGVVRYHLILGTDWTYGIPYYDEKARERASLDPYASPAEPLGYAQHPVTLIWREAAIHVGIHDMKLRPPEPKSPSIAPPTGLARAVLEKEWREQNEGWGSYATSFEEFLAGRTERTERLRAEHTVALERWRTTRWFTREEIAAASVLWTALYGYRIAARSLAARVLAARRDGEPVPEAEINRGTRAVSDAIALLARTPGGSWIAGTLRELLGRGVILRDIHDGNVGIVMREGEERWAVTDPGQAVFLRGDPPVTIPVA